MSAWPVASRPYPMSVKSHAIILSLIGFLLFGYAVGSKTFAYLGVADIYIGEIVLATSLALFAFSPNLRAVLGSYVSLPFFLLAFICFMRTLPFLGEFGIFALRDSVIYGYMLFAVLVAGCLSTPQAMLISVRMYEYAALLAIPAIFVVLMFIGISVGEEEAPAQLKPGDTAVHLTGVLAFFMLGLGRRIDRNDHGWPALLFRIALMTTLLIAVLVALWCASLSRGALLSMLLGLGALFLWGFGRKLLTWTAIGMVVVMVISIVLDLRIETRTREVSARQVAANLISVFDVDSASIAGSDIDMEALGSTASWRLDWWSDIVDYTFYGDMFWTGRGFGPNLATIDGYQVDPNGALRSPHNAHMTFLARAGVPGFMLWVTAQLTFGVALVFASLRMRRIQALGWLRLNVWVMAYWLAALTNASFDVYLEGPQGGIWFWCIIGIGVALIHMENNAYRARTRSVVHGPLAAVE